MKKIISLCLALVVTAGLSTVAFVAGSKIVGLSEEFIDALESDGMQEILRGAPVEGARDYRDDLTNLEVYADAEIIIPLTTYMALDVDGGNYLSAVGRINLTQSDIRSGKVKLVKQVFKGGTLLREAVIEQAEADIKFEPSSSSSSSSTSSPSSSSSSSLSSSSSNSPSSSLSSSSSYTASKTACISIKFVENFVSVEEKDFDYKFTLSVAGEKEPLTEFRVSGTMVFDTIDNADTGSQIDLSGGDVLDADKFAQQVEFDLGNGVFITTNIFEKQKYYGKATMDSDATDLLVMRENPGVQTAITMHTVNLKGSGNIVSFRWEPTEYVYDDAGAYLGTTAEKLPYSDKYYIADKKADTLNVPGSANE